MKILLYTFSILALGLLPDSRLTWDEHQVCLTSEEVKLYELITEHRLENGLPAIPLSVNLSRVAQLHALDLFENKPDTGECNLHSWSDKGPWEECCYTDQHLNPHCMWDKPMEITTYKGRGYEIVFHYWPVTENVNLALNAINGWKGSPGHNNTILNRGVFSQAQWNAIGIGIVEGYVTVWFGELEDKDGPPPFCINE